MFHMKHYIHNLEIVDVRSSLHLLDKYLTLNPKKEFKNIFCQKLHNCKVIQSKNFNYLLNRGARFGFFFNTSRQSSVITCGIAILHSYKPCMAKINTVTE